MIGLLASLSHQEITRLIQSGTTGLTLRITKSFNSILKFQIKTQYYSLNLPFSTLGLMLCLLVTAIAQKGITGNHRNPSYSIIRPKEPSVSKEVQTKSKPLYFYNFLLNL